MITETMNEEMPIVLIVDHTRANLAVLCRQLKKANFRVLIAESGRRAIELARLNTHLTIHSLQQPLKKQNEVLEKRVKERAQELTKANQQLQRANEELTRVNKALAEEIVRRKQYEQEKDNLFAMIRQQSDQLSALTNLLITMQQKPHHGLARGLHQQVEQNLKQVRSNLDFVVSILTSHHHPSHFNIIEKTILNTQQTLSRTELYLQSIEVDSHTSEEKQLLENPLFKLSSREREVLQFLIEGKAYQEIARVLSISQKSVSTYRSRIMKKLEMDNMADTIKFAIKHGLTNVS